MIYSNNIKISKKKSIREERLLAIFKILGDPCRFSIMRIISVHPDTCISSMAKILKISISAVSHQCRILETAGMVRRIKIGKSVCYEIRNNDEIVKSVCDFISKNKKGRVRNKLKI